MTRSSSVLTLALLLLASTACQHTNDAPLLLVGQDSVGSYTDTSSWPDATGSTDDVVDPSGSDTTTTVPGDTAGPDTMPLDIDDNADDHVYVEDGATYIYLEHDSVEIVGSGATAYGTAVSIYEPKTFIVSGTLDDGRLVVLSEDEGTVKLVLAGVDIYSSIGAAIYVKEADKTVVLLEEEKTNYLEDGTAYELEEGEDEPNACIFSKDDLTITGEGSLSVVGNYNDAIASKDDLLISGGDIAVDAVDDGLRGKDCVVIKGATVHVTSGGDGIKSDNEDDTTKGYVHMSASTVEVVASGDAVTAASVVTVASGSLDLTAGGGSSVSPSDATSTKGIKGLLGVQITGGTIVVDSSDDSLHSNGTMDISGGTMILSTKDDGLHADEDLTMDDGDITVTTSYEGLESNTVLTINGGTIHVTSSDDGLNVAGGNDGSGMSGPGGGPPGWPGETGGDYYLYLNGGYIYVNAQGDALDCNGTMTMSGGTAIVDGPTGHDNGAIDYDGSFSISGGTLVAAGSSGMAQAPGFSSTQRSVLIYFSSTQSAGTLVNIQSTGSSLMTYAPSKQFESLVYSSPSLQLGTSYSIYLGGSSSGTVTDGFYEGGTYTPGSLYKTFSVTTTTTQVNQY